MRLILLLFASVAISGQPGDFAIRYADEVNRQHFLPPGILERYAATVEQTPQLGRGEFVGLVDRHPEIQTFVLYWKGLDGQAHLVGASPVSTGLPGRFEYFESPLGVFAHTLDNPDYRALGTRNEFGIRGYGRKGMRVYDFGWVASRKGWGDKRQSVLRLQMHSTDPDLLEPRLGRPLSKGCIRIPESLNRFLDRYGILDADYVRAAAAGNRHFTLTPDWAPGPWSGRYLVIVDSRLFPDRRSPPEPVPIPGWSPP